jgi:hypothetical protein
VELTLKLALIQLQTPWQAEEGKEIGRHRRLYVAALAAKMLGPHIAAGPAFMLDRPRLNHL